MGCFTASLQGSWAPDLSRRALGLCIAAQQQGPMAKVAGRPQRKTPRSRHVRKLLNDAARDLRKALVRAAGSQGYPGDTVPYQLVRDWMYVPAPARAVSVPRSLRFVIGRSVGGGRG